MMTMQLQNGVCRARVDGDMTIYTACEDRVCLLECLRMADELELDLSAVEAIDSAGAQLLILAKREGARLGKPVRLLGHSPAVMELIDLFQLAPQFGDPMLIAALAPHPDGEPA